MGQDGDEPRRRWNSDNRTGVGLNNGAVAQHDRLVVANQQVLGPLANKGLKMDSMLQKAWLVVFAGFLAGAASTRAQAPLVVSTTMNFSDLDGGAQDLDGLENGTLTTNSLLIVGTGAIVVDVPSASFDISGSLVMMNSAAIRTPSIVVMDPGPDIAFQSTGSLVMNGNSIIRSNGITFGGKISALFEGHIVLRDRAKIEANSTVAAGVGGIIQLEALWEIVLLHSNTQVSASGMSGGEVHLRATMSNHRASIGINGTVKAVGFDGDGGVVEITALHGGVTIVNGTTRIAAHGTTSRGEITIFASCEVRPNPPSTQPTADVTELGSACFN